MIKVYIEQDDPLQYLLTPLSQLGWTPRGYSAKFVKEISEELFEEYNRVTELHKDLQRKIEEVCSKKEV